MSGKVYIVLINYNGFKDTIECIESILKSDYKNYQIIVVDNNSTDNSMNYLIDWAEVKSSSEHIKYSDKLKHMICPLAHKPVKYVFYKKKEAEQGGNKVLENKIGKNSIVFIQSDYNGGFSYGINIALRYVLKKDDFDYIWLLNNDTIIENETLSNMVNLLSQENRIGMVGSKILYYYDTNLIQAICGNSEVTSWRNAGLSDVICSNYKDIEIDKNIKGINTKDGKFEMKGALLGASMLIRKETVKDVGFFDENYFMQVEETDFCFRVMQKSWKIFCCSNSKIYHKEGGSAKPSEIKRFLWRRRKRPSLQRFAISPCIDIRNRIYFVRKFYGNTYVFFYLLFNFSFILRHILRVLLYDENKTKRIVIFTKCIADGILNKMGKPKWFEELFKKTS